MPECLSCGNELDESSLTTAVCSKCAHLASPCGCTELAWTALEQRVKALEAGLAGLKQEYERHSGRTHAEPDLR